jgi:hypothetical protein
MNAFCCAIVLGLLAQEPTPAANVKEVKFAELANAIRALKGQVVVVDIFIPQDQELKIYYQ